MENSVAVTIEWDFRGSETILSMVAQGAEVAHIRLCTLYTEDKMRVGVTGTSMRLMQLLICVLLSFSAPQSSCVRRWCIGQNVSV